MKDVQIDVEMEIHASDWLIERSRADRDAFARQAIEKMRDTASAHAEVNGGYLRTDRLPELNSMRAAHAVFGTDLVLVASRWWCVMPESFDPARAAANSR